MILPYRAASMISKEMVLEIAYRGRVDLPEELLLDILSGFGTLRTSCLFKFNSRFPPLPSERYKRSSVNGSMGELVIMENLRTEDPEFLLEKLTRD